MSTIPQSKERILEAAARLFAEHGFDATSLRTITSEAGVNLAAVHYHFGSKEALIQAVFERCMGPVNLERVQLLNEVEEAADGAPELEAVLEAFVGPAFRFRHAPGSRSAIVLRLFGRMYATLDTRVRAIFLCQFHEVRERFTAALARALPDLPREELYWRMHFMIGAMAQTMADPERLLALSDNTCDPYDAEATIVRLVPFLAAGLRASVVHDAPRDRDRKTQSSRVHSRTSGDGAPKRRGRTARRGRS